MENFSGAAPVISYPLSPDPTEGVYQDFTEEGGVHCATEEPEDTDASPPLVRSASSPDRILSNRNLPGHKRDNVVLDDDDDDDENDRCSSPSIPPTTSPEPPSLDPPTGIRPSEMRAPSTHEMYHDMLGDLDVMMEIARSMHELARHTKSVLRAAYERVDLGDPRVQNLGIAGVMKDLRQESAHAVVDGQRAQLRYEKVLTDIRRMRRCLRNLGFWRIGGGGGVGLSSAESHSPPLPETTWGLPYHSYFSNNF